MNDIETNMDTKGLVDLSSENAPDYLRGNMRRMEAEKARQERKIKRLEEESRFFEDIINNVLLPNGLVTEKEKEFIFLKDKATRSKNFWDKWLSNYNLAQSLNGGEDLRFYMKNEFHKDPAVFFQGKMGSLPKNLFDSNYYLDKLARFAADFQTEWKTPHFSTKKNEAGANILVEENDSERNLEARQIVHTIWDFMDDFDQTNCRILDYYKAVSTQLSKHPPHQNQPILAEVFENPGTLKEFECERFELLRKYSQVLFLVKDNWEMRLNRKYDGFTDAEDVNNTINTFLEKRLEMIDAMFSE